MNKPTPVQLHILRRLKPLRRVNKPSSASKPPREPTHSIELKARRRSKKLSSVNKIAHLADQLDGCQHNWKQVTAENVELRIEVERLRGVLGAVRTMVHYIFETGNDHESRKALEIIDIIHQALEEQP